MVTNNSPGAVEFRARLGAGAHGFPGSSLAIAAAIARNVQIAKLPWPWRPDLAITNSVRSANAGDSISYNLTYTNPPARRTGAQVTDFLPGAVTFVSCSGGCTLIGNEIVWDIAMSTAQQRSLTYEVMVDAGAAGGLSFTTTPRF